MYYVCTVQKCSKCASNKVGMDQKGTTFDHDFYVFVVKQCRTENAYAGHQHNIINYVYNINALLLLICFKLVLKSMKLFQF